MSLYDNVFESRDQRMGTHRGKTHSSGHPLAPIKDGFSTGHGTSSMGSSAWARAQRDNEKKTERQAAKRDLTLPEPAPAPRPGDIGTFRFGKTARDRAHEKARSGSVSNKERRELSQRDSAADRVIKTLRTLRSAPKKPLTPEEADATLKLRKREDKRAARLAKWAGERAEKQRKQKELSQAVFSALKTNSSPVISSSIDLGRASLVLDDVELTKRGDERLKDLASIENYKMTGPVNPALRLRHTGRDKKVVTRAVEKLKLKKRN